MNNQIWRSVSSKEECPICGKDSWCRLDLDGATVLCRRESRGAINQKLDKNGVDYFIHRIGVDPILHRKRIQSHIPDVPLASTVELNQVYQFLLDQLSLSDEHHKLLGDRGFTYDEIDALGYRSIYSEGRYELAESLVKKFGETLCAQVPGIYYRKVRREKVWCIYGCSGSGLLIPSRNSLGQIEAIKVRSDIKDSNRKYFYISSKAVGGPSPGARVHVPLFLKDRRDLIRITEGELKADLSSMRTSIHTISIPGVQSWRMALPLLRELAVKRVRVAFDADAKENIYVARSLSEVASALQNDGFIVEIETWN